MAPTRELRPLLRVDPRPMLLGCVDPAIAFFSRRDLLGQEAGPVSALWELREARKILARQNGDGSWSYPGGGKRDVRTRANYDQLETFRQLGTLTALFGLRRPHPAVERAAEYLFSFQTREGDLRGIYGYQYATTYVGAIAEVLVHAGYGRDPRVDQAFRWLLSARQSDGGWAIPSRTAGLPFTELMRPERRRDPTPPVTSKPSSHLVTGMVLRAFAVHPVHRRSAAARRAGELLASRLYKKDAYGDRGDVAYWDRVAFPFWFTDIVSALDSLSRLGLPPGSPPVRAALEHVRDLQRADGTFAFRLLKGKNPALPLWICLAICRSLSRWGLMARGGAVITSARYRRT